MLTETRLGRLADLRDDSCVGVDGGVSVNYKADLFEQTKGETKAPPHRCC